jgi:hypothetical protein
MDCVLSLNPSIPQSLNHSFYGLHHFTMFSTRDVMSPFIDPNDLSFHIHSLMTQTYGNYADWCRMEVCHRLASKLLNDFGFVSSLDLHIKIATYVETGYIDMVSSQIPIQPVQQAPMETSKTPPKYTLHSLKRGETEDKFFSRPLNAGMVDNAYIINVLNSGTDEEVCALPNLSCSCPAVKMKCDMSSDTIIFIQATHFLMSHHGVKSLADVYRYLGMLGDRKCLWCKDNTSSKISCVSGTFQCINCLNKYKRMTFSEGFKAWLDAGCPAKHAKVM